MYGYEAETHDVPKALKLYYSDEASKDSDRRVNNVMGRPVVADSCSSDAGSWREVI